MLVVKKIGGLRYWFPELSSVIRMIGLVFLPLVVLMIEFIALCKCRKNTIRFLLTLLCLCFWMVSVSVFKAGMYMIPIKSETSEINNYLIADRDISWDDAVNNVFPQSFLFENHEYMYSYYRESYVYGECCVALAVKYSDEKSFFRERDRLHGIQGLIQVNETDDGYAKHLWDNYMTFNFNGMDSFLSRYIWVLISDESRQIIYYHKVFGFHEDDFLEPFLHSVNISIS